MTAVVERPATDDAERAAAVGMVVTRPGVYPDMPADQYHADPVPGGSLSSTGARKLLAPSCPALYRHWADNREPYKKEFSFGSAAHALVLGAGPKVVVIEYGDWRTNDAKEKRAEVLAAGDIPVLPHELAVVKQMAAQIKEHPEAAAAFAPGSGRPEVSIFWQDSETGVRCRARFDWLRHAPTNGRVVAPDYKTAVAVDPESLQKAIYNHGYHIQAAFYLDGLRRLGLSGPDAQFLFIFQLKTAPYIVTPVQLDPLALQIGRYEMTNARRTYAECVTSGRWPGFTDGVEILPLPRWIENQYKDEEIW